MPERNFDGEFIDKKNAEEARNERLLIAAYDERVQKVAEYLILGKGNLDRQTSYDDLGLVCIEHGLLPMDKEVVLEISEEIASKAA